MAFLCKISGHKWQGCKCARCGETRDEGHALTGIPPQAGQCAERCTVCGVVKRKPHSYVPAPGKCVKVCTVCGAEEPASAAQHDFQPAPGKCVKVCAVCGAEEPASAAQHDFQPAPGKCVKVCCVCGAEEAQHKAQHSYQPVDGKCEEACSVCGETRKRQHEFKEGRCVRCGKSIDAPGDSGIPPLIWAAFNGELDEVRALIKGGANVNLCTDETALMAAARKGYDEPHVQIVKLLLASGADVNATDRMGSSAVRLAQRKGLTKMVELLHSHGGKYLGA